MATRVFLVSARGLVFLACLVLLAVAGGATVACSGSPDIVDGDQVAKRKEALLNATFDEEHKYPFVGYVASNTSTEGLHGECSGVQLSCGAVLTAAHCVSGGINTGTGVMR